MQEIYRDVIVFVFRRNIRFYTFYFYNFIFFAKSAL